MSIDPEMNAPDSEEEDDLFEHFNFTVDKGQQLLRIDKYLMIKIAGTSRNRIQVGIDAGSVKVNGGLIKSNYRVKPLDTILVSFANPPRDKEVYPEEIPIDIIYEDDQLILVNKSPGMVVHPAQGNWSGTLVNGLLFHCQNLPGQKDIRPGLVHRIDKDTSGILVIGKTEFALNFLGQQFFEHTIERTYYAICWGVPKELNGTIRSKIGRSPKDRKIQAIFPEDSEQGRIAITHYEVMETYGFASFVKFKLETGRTHQIRAHFQSIGHPLFSDATYGGDKIRYMSTMSSYKSFIDNAFKICPRQALHAYSLGFIHPTTNEFMQFEQEFPEDFLSLLTKLRAING